MIPRYVTDTDEPCTMIPDRVTAMLFAEGYFIEFWRVVRDSACSHKDAWALCEATLLLYGFPHRYDSYESFRVMKSKLSGNKGGDSAGKIYVW